MSKKTDALIGKRVRMNNDLVTVDGNPHAWAGCEGEVLTRNGPGRYQIALGEEVKVLSIDDFTVADGTTLGRSAWVQAAPALAVHSLTNPRRRKGLDMDSLAALASSIKVHGLAQAILVRPLPAQRVIDTAHMEPRPTYEIIAGERRWRACQLAGLEVMPMLVRDMSDEAVLEMQLVENIEREDLDDMEEAEGFERLRQQLGYTVAQIAERIGKGKGESYVYKALKLCELSMESREAMYPPAEGKPAILGRSTGLLVARYKPEQQAEVIKYIASLAEPDGEPAPFRKVAPLVYKRFNLALATAPFDTADGALLAAAGACTTCTKRSGNQPALFGDGGDAVDSCTDPDCFAQKRDLHVAQVKAKAEADGFTVLDGDAARQAKMSPHQRHLVGYVRLDDLADVEEGNDGIEREVTYEDKLRSLGKKAPKPMVFIDPDTGTSSKVIPLAVADKLTPADEPSKTKPSRPSPKLDTRPHEQQALDNRQTERAAITRMFDAIRAKPRTVAETRMLAKVLLEERADDACLRTTEYLGWDADLEDLDDQEVAKVIAAKVDALPIDDLGQLVAMAALERYWDGWHTTAEQRLALLESYGIDILAVRDKVAEDLAKQDGSAQASEESAA